MAGFLIYRKLFNGLSIVTEPDLCVLNKKAQGLQVFCCNGFTKVAIDLWVFSHEKRFRHKKLSVS